MKTTYIWPSAARSLRSAKGLKAKSRDVEKQVRKATGSMHCGAMVNTSREPNAWTEIPQTSSMKNFPKLQQLFVKAASHLVVFHQILQSCHFLIARRVSCFRPRKMRPLFISIPVSLVVIIELVIADLFMDIWMLTLHWRNIVPTAPQSALCAP